jgi:nitrite reductase/ring-hydroxylating ferredoxin subunit
MDSVFVETADIPDDLPLRIEVDGEAIAVCRVGERFYAVADMCTHALARLSDGYLEDRTLECPLHGGAFDVVTGTAVSAPCVEPVRTYEVIVDESGQKLEVRR